MADADSLIILIDNDQRFANIRQAVDKQLALKKVRGVYDHEMAVKAFAFLAEEIAKYAEKSHASWEERPQRPWHLAYPANARRELQQELAHRFETKWSIPAERVYLEKELPKKYQGGKHRTAQLSETDIKARRRGAYSAAELERMKTISEGHMENLFETGNAEEAFRTLKRNLDATLPSRADHHEAGHNPKTRQRSVGLPASLQIEPMARSSAQKLIADAERSVALRRGTSPSDLKARVNRVLGKKGAR